MATDFALQPAALCVQDTNSLNYSTHPQTQGLGPIGNHRDKTIGLFLHPTLAITPAGQSLGLLHAQSWVRSHRKFSCLPSPKVNKRPTSGTAVRCARILPIGPEIR